MASERLTVVIKLGAGTILPRIAELRDLMFLD